MFRVLAAGDPVENLKSWVIAILVGALYVAVIVGLVRGAFKFTPVAIIGAILLGAIVMAAPFIIPKVADSVKAKSDATTPVPDPTGAGSLFSGNDPTPTSAGG